MAKQRKSSSKKKPVKIVPKVLPADSSSSVAIQQTIHEQVSSVDSQTDLSSVSSNFQSDMDSWVKSFNARLTKSEQIVPRLEEVVQNTDYNYELLQEQKKEIESLKAEIRKLHNLMTVALRSRSLKDISFE